MFRNSPNSTVGFLKKTTKRKRVIVRNITDSKHTIMVQNLYKKVDRSDIN